MNALVITFHALTMLFDHSKLLFHGDRITTYVAGIGILSHQLERDFFAIAPDQQWDMRFLDAFGLVNRATHLVIVALKVCLLLSPHRQYDLHGLAQMTKTLRAIRIFIAIGAIFLLIP